MKQFDHTNRTKEARMNAEKEYAMFEREINNPYDPKNEAAWRRFRRPPYYLQGNAGKKGE